MKKPNVPFVNEVEDFNNLMSKPNNYTPVIPEKKEWQFVYDFVLEELEEYKQACEKGDIVEILDALVDICYVAMGTAWLMGLPFEKAWKEVQRSNMEKIRQASDRSEFDVVKPEGWKKPDIKGRVNKWRKS